MRAASLHAVGICPHLDDVNSSLDKIEQFLRLQHNVAIDRVKFEERQQEEGESAIGCVIRKRMYFVAMFLFTMLIIVSVLLSSCNKFPATKKSFSHLAILPNLSQPSRL